MSDFSTPLASGFRVRHIQTKTVNGKIVPVLDANGQEIEVYSVDVPLAIEAVEGPPAARAAVISGFVQDIQSKGADVALLRADAAIAGDDPNAAEAAFSAAQQVAAAEAAAEAAADATDRALDVVTVVQPGGKV